MANPPPSPDHWSLDKRVPIALIVTMIGQAFLFVWWAAKLDSRVDSVEIRLVREEALNSRQSDTAADLITRLVRMEERTYSMLDILKRLDQRLGGGGVNPGSHP